MLKMLIKKIPDDSEFFETQDFKKVNFNAKMVEPSKNFVDQNQAETWLELGDKNREKNRKTLKFLFKVFRWQNYFGDDRLQNCFMFKKLFKFLKHLLILLIKLLDGTLEGYWKKVLQLLLHQTTILLQKLLLSK